MQRVIFLAVTLAVATVVSACCGPATGSLEADPELRTRQTRAPGEYLVTLVAPDRVKAIVDRYGQFGIKGIQNLGNHLFLVTLTEDPGPARMEQLRGEDDHIQAVQPNFVYGTREPARLPRAR
jgi:hypothetical protein